MHPMQISKWIPIFSKSLIKDNMNETRAYIDSNTKDTKDLNIKNEQPGDHFDHPD